MARKPKEENLNVNEQLEIKEDVKDALGKAFKGKKTSIDKTLDEGTLGTLNQAEVDKIMSKRNKNSDKKPIIITIILTILIVLTGLFMYFSNNPKTIFKKFIDKSFDTVEKNVIPKYNKIKGNFTLNFELSENNKKVTNVQVVTNYSEDVKANILVLDTKVRTDDNEVINSQVYKEEENTYLYFQNVLDKYIKTDGNIPSKDQMKTILHSLNRAINKGISNEKIIGGKTQINVDGKMTKTYKSALTFDKDDYDAFLDVINDDLIADENFVNAISDITGNKEAKDEIDKKITRLKNDFGTEDSMTINIYTKGASQKFVKLEVSKTKGGMVKTFNLTNSGNKYSYLINDQVKNENISGNIIYIKEKNNLNINFDMKRNNAKFKVSLNNNYQKTDKIKKIDVSDNVLVTDLTDEQKKNVNERHNISFLVD